MANVTIKGLNISKISSYLLVLLTITLLFPFKKLTFLYKLLESGQYSDFSTLSLYSGDIILLFIFIIVLISRGKELSHVVKNTRFLVFWLILVTILNFSTFSAFSAWFLVKFISFFVAYGTMAVIFRETAIKSRFFLIFISFASIQSLIALAQFIFQGPIGLNIVGEQIIYPYQTGVAKIIMEGVAYIRGYGTFPHPNLLSAFLVTSVLAIIHYLFEYSSKISRFFLFLALFINILGLIVTFSRAGYLALLIGFAIYFGFHVATKALSKKMLFIGGVTCLMLLVGVALFAPFINTRNTISDQASLERVFYSQVGFTIIKNSPIYGIGVGESVFHMQQYSPIPLKPWQIQPIHNYFLLAAAEFGIIGVLLLIWFLYRHLRGLISKLKNSQTANPFPLLLLSIFVAYATLMQFDHYFYTLQQTQMLLWIVLGIIAAETQSVPKIENYVTIGKQKIPKQGISFCSFLSRRYSRDSDLASE